MKDRLPGAIVKGISSAGYWSLFILYFLFREGFPCSGASL